LSTGQLNGLSIAFLLAIKNVYGDVDGLDILLIDDPLQTIDDISEISLADLLTQQGIGQIVLSTHEDAKAALLRYKFKKQD
jgi:ABC-type phosphate transport system ATPase subunit